MDDEIVPRSAWGAADALGYQSVEHPLENLVYYYSNTRYPQCYTHEQCKIAMAELQRKHFRVLKMPDIAFNFVIAGDGRIYEGRGWNYFPPRFKHIHHMNKQAFLIGVLGDLLDRPSQTTWAATWRILEIAVKHNYVTENVYLTAEDKFEKDIFSRPGEEEINMLKPSPENKFKIEKLAADLRPSINLSQFWKDPPDLARTDPRAFDVANLMLGI